MGGSGARARRSRRCDRARRLETLETLVDATATRCCRSRLDVTDRDADFDAVKQAADHFGRLDVVVNNAGYGHFGMVEELSEDEVRAQMETNFFGALWVTQAALPIMRAQGRVTSSRSRASAASRVPRDRRLPRVEVGARGLSPVAGPRGRGLRHPVTLVEPGGLRPTGAARRRSTARTSRRTPTSASGRNRSPAGSPGDPAATRAAILEVVDAGEPPLRIFFGKAPLGIATREYESRLALWNGGSPSRSRPGELVLHSVRTS